MRPRVTGDTCQCGRPVLVLKNMKLCECGVHPAFCTCHAIGLVGADRLLEDVRRNW